MKSLEIQIDPVDSSTVTLKDTAIYYSGYIYVYKSFATTFQDAQLNLYQRQLKPLLRVLLYLISYHRCIASDKAMPFSNFRPSTHSLSLLGIKILPSFSILNTQVKLKAIEMIAEQK